MTAPCVECDAGCCKAGAHGWQEAAAGVPFEDGRCPHLTASGRCAIYEDRPENCRAFDCTVQKVPGLPLLAEKEAMGVQ